MATETQIKTAELRLIPRSAVVAIRADGEGDARYSARFRGPEPTIREKGTIVTIEYPLLRGTLRRRVAELELNPSLAWAIQIDGGVSKLVADLGGLWLRSFEITGGASDVQIVLPDPSGTVAVRVGGGASKVSLRRPADTKALLRIAGGASKLTFGDEHFGGIGGEIRLTSVGTESQHRRSP